MTISLSPASLPAVAAAPASAGAARGARGFSYDAAVAAIERQSARALEAHGGAPTQNVTGARASDTAAPTPNDAANPQTRAQASDAAQTSYAYTPTRRAIRAETPATAIAAAIPPAPSPVNGLPATATATAPTTAPAGAARDGALRLAAETTRAVIRPHAPPAAVKQFAEILAQRLDNASQFDLRLDPLALGGVEGRLTLGDDGDAVLALAFDNPSTLDLFRRDEAALRQTLADAGFDLDGRHLRFSYREPSAADGAPEPRANVDLNPSFVTPAAHHRGAVDIRA